VQLIEKVQQSVEAMEFDASSIRHILNNEELEDEIKERFESMGLNLKSALMRQSQSEIVDLKTEICTLKNKLIQSENKKLEELRQKQEEIKGMEQKLREEERRHIEDADEKEKKIEDLEREIENAIEGTITENKVLQ